MSETPKPKFDQNVYPPGTKADVIETEVQPEADKKTEEPKPAKK